MIFNWQIEQRRKNWVIDFPVHQEKAEYKIVSLSEDFNDSGYWDSKIIKTVNGVDEVLVPSVKAAIPELGKELNHSLLKLSFPSTGSALFFVEVLLDTDAPPMDIFKFDLRTKTFTKLSSSEYYSGYGTKALSPDGEKIIALKDTVSDPNIQKLWVIDLPTDTVKLAVELSGNESFNGCSENCFSGIAGEISWLDNDTIQYSVYDSSNKMNTGKYPDFQLIEVRTVDVK